jgi:hypothetical protein
MPIDDAWAGLQQYAGNASRWCRRDARADLFHAHASCVGGGSVIGLGSLSSSFHQHVHLEGQFFHCQAQRAQLLGDVRWPRQFWAGRPGSLDALLCREASSLTDDRSGGDARKLACRSLSLRSAGIPSGSVGAMCVDFTYRYHKSVWWYALCWACCCRRMIGVIFASR